MIAVGIIIVLIGIGLYMLWRKISSSEIRLATTDKTVSDLRMSSSKIEQELKNRDEKIQELMKEVSDLRNKNTELSFQVKELKKQSKMKPQVRVQSKKSSKQCDDTGCTTDVQDIE